MKDESYLLQAARRLIIPMRSIIAMESRKKRAVVPRIGLLAAPID